MTRNDVPARANRPLRHPARGPAELPAARSSTTAAAGPAWPSDTGTAQPVGMSSTGVTVFVDPSLGFPGHQNAQDLLAGADRVVQQNNTIFGTTGGAVLVLVFALNGKTDGTGGADHGGCDITTGNAIEVDASSGDSARVTALFEAELSECTMNNRPCGLATGEALSQWSAVVGANALPDFATAPQWAQDGMPNLGRSDPRD